MISPPPPEKHDSDLAGISGSTAHKAALGIFSLRWVRHISSLKSNPLTVPHQIFSTPLIYPPLSSCIRSHIFIPLISLPFLSLSHVPLTPLTQLARISTLLISLPLPSSLSNIPLSHVPLTQLTHVPGWYVSKVQ